MKMPDGPFSLLICHGNPEGVWDVLGRRAGQGSRVWISGDPQLPETKAKIRCNEIPNAIIWLKMLRK